MSYKNVFVLAAIALMAVLVSACGGSKWTPPDGCQPGNNTNMAGQSCVEPTPAPSITEGTEASKKVGEVVPLVGKMQKGYDATVDDLTGKVGKQVQGSKAAEAQGALNMGMQGHCGSGFHIGSDGDCAPGNAWK